MSNVDLPAARGTYVLVLKLENSVTAQAGRLGTAHLEAGWTIYVGSAHGPGGLRARLRRHLRPDKAVHWHIDALTAVAPVSVIWVDTSPVRLECVWARTLAALPGVTIPLKGFGSSDCGCESHLFQLRDVNRVWDALGRPRIVCCDS